jgi:hypothetical protein
MRAANPRALERSENIGPVLIESSIAPPLEPWATPPRLPCCPAGLATVPLYESQDQRSAVTLSHPAAVTTFSFNSPTLRDGTGLLSLPPRRTALQSNCPLYLASPRCLPSCRPSARNNLGWVGANSTVSSRLPCPSTHCRPPTPQPPLQWPSSHLLHRSLYELDTQGARSFSSNEFLAPGCLPTASPSSPIDSDTSVCVANEPTIFQ